MLENHKNKNYMTKYIVARLIVEARVLGYIRYI